MRWPKGYEEPSARATLRGLPLDEAGIKAIPDGTLTLDDWGRVRGNSPSFKLLYPKLNDEALGQVIRHNLSNCGELGAEGTYPHTLQHVLIPLLLQRLRDKR